MKTEAAFAGPNFQHTAEHVSICSTCRTTSAAKALEVTTAVSFSGGGLCFESRTAWPYLHTRTFAWQVGGLSSCCGQTRNLANIWPCQSQEAVDMDSFKTGISLPSPAASVVGGWILPRYPKQAAGRLSRANWFRFFRFPI